MSGPRLGALSINRLSGGTVVPQLYSLTLLSFEDKILALFDEFIVGFFFVLEFHRFISPFF